MSTSTIPTFFSWRSSFQKSDLPSTTKLILFCISTYMNDHGRGCFPSIKTLMQDSSLSNKAVITHIKKAQDVGFLTVGIHGFSGQGWKRNEYTIAFPENNKVVNVIPEGGEPHDQKVVNEVHTNTPSNTPSNTKIIIKDFEVWWKAYPKKVGKDAVKRKYEVLVKNKTVTEKLLMQALERIIPTWKKTETQFIPHPATWLNQGRWNDEVKKQKPSYLC